MKFKISLLLIILVLSACSVDELYFIVIPRYTDSTVTPVTVTHTATVSPTNTLQPTATASPTIPPSLTPTATITPTIDPTPTRESINRIRITSNANIRVSANGAVCRVGQSNSVFNVLSKSGDWLQIADAQCPNAWLFYGPDWVEFISGSFGNVPVSQALSQSRLGYNALEVYDENYYFAHVEQFCPKYLLFMDNFTLAVKAYERLNPSCGTEIIHRNFSSFEGEEFLHRTPKQFVDRWKAEGHPEIIRYSTNEPSCGGNTPCALLVSHEVELARLAREAGYTVALGNLGVGKFSPNDVTNGVYNPLIRAIVDYDHIFGAHEYTWGCLCFGFGTMPKSYLTDSVLIDPPYWANEIPYDFASVSAQLADYEGELPYGIEAMQDYYAAQFYAEFVSQCGALPTYWHLGRSFWILLWAECTLGIDSSQIEVVHTEWGWDYLSDINDVIEPLKLSYAHPQYEYNLRGWRSLEYLWRFYWSDWSMAESAYNQIGWAMSKYPDNHSFLLFTWSDNPNRDWTRAGFSFGNYGDSITYELQELIEGN